MNKITLSAEPRKITGRKVKNLRKDGWVPANIYGKKVKSASIQVKIDEFNKVYKEAGETGLIEISLGKEPRPVLIHAVQTDPVSDSLLHVDFRQVDLKEKVEAEVPVEIAGESPAEKSGVGTVVQYVNEVKVEALPTDLPEKFVVDVSVLAEVDQQIAIKDLVYDKAKVEVKDAAETIVVKVEPPQKEEAPAPAPAAEVPAEGETPAPVEGEVPTEAKAEGAEPVEEEKSKEEPKA